jgi:predicted nucleic acid-binding protein
MYKTLVMDASSLILLGKCGLVEILSKEFRVIIPGKVFGEVADEQILKQYPDPNAIAELVHGGKIEVTSIEEKSVRFPITLDEGETEAILLARQVENAILVTDDGKAIKACRYLKLPFIISPKVVTDLYRTGKISMLEAKRSIEKLGIIGRYSPEIISEALIRLKEARDVETNNRKSSG